MAADTAPTLSALLSRVFWMLLGPLLLVVFAFQIINKGQGWFTPVDIAYLLVLGGMLLARWWEFRSGTAQTTMGEPATATDLRRYAITTVVVGLAVWIIANVFGNHVL
jgi:hypothetical protein